MDHRVIEGVMERIAPLIKQFTEGATQKSLDPIQQSIEKVARRVGDLEERGVLKGEKGDPGERGADGERGKDGVDGRDGAPARDGIDGKDGRDGTDGPPGKDGRDGTDGLDGKDGERGPPGDIAFAPDYLAERVASAIQLLHESPPVQVASAVTAPVNISLDLAGAHTKRSWRFERGPDNRLKTAHEEVPI
jgi:hypothetical protein